jgi:hypothetical protein
VRIISERTELANVAARWKATYYGAGRWADTRAGNTEPVYRALLALPPDATGKDVAKIIGNGSWAGPQKCHECDSMVYAVVEIGQEPDYDSATASVCLPCLRKAVALLEQQAAPAEKQPCAR